MIDTLALGIVALLVLVLLSMDTGRDVQSPQSR